MAGCGEIKKLLPLWVDGELGEGDGREVELHLKDCGACRAEADASSLLKSKLRQGLPRAKAPSALRAKVASATSPAPSGARWFGWVAVPAAAALGLLLSSMVLDQTSNAAPLVEESVERHAVDLPVEIPGPSNERVSSWFRGKVAFPVRVPRLPGGTNLLGGRLSPMNQEIAAHLMYERHGHKITVLVFDPYKANLQPPRSPRVKIKDRDVYLSNAHGYQVAVFQEDGVGYAVTADIGDQELTNLVAAGWAP